MKALLLVMIISNNSQSTIKTVEVPVRDYGYCLSIADETGEAVAQQLGTFAREVSTNCIKTNPV